MILSSAETNQQTSGNHWEDVYKQQLGQYLVNMIQYVNEQKKTSKTHLGSMLGLLEESSRYPELQVDRHKLIDTLHPLPLLSGFSAQWDVRIRELISDPSYADKRVTYLNALSEIHLNSGRFSEAINTGERVLREYQPDVKEAARAIRNLFVTHRSMGDADSADRIFKKFGQKFKLIAEPDPRNHAQISGWLKYHACELDLLREKGKVDQALDLAHRMISLDDQLRSEDKILSAELHVHRSTLLWVKAQYTSAIQDLEQAQLFYQQEDDYFNSESLKSNLGLIYWTMGELDKAEKYLNESIRFYQKCGAEQFMAYDIGNLGLVYFARGEIDKAHAKTLEHIRHSERIGFTTEAYRGHTNLGDILYYYGKYEDVIREHEMIDGYFAQRGSREGFGMGKVWMACCHGKCGEVERAVTELREILTWCELSGSKVLEALVHRALAQFLPWDERETHLRYSLALAREQGRLLEIAACQLMLASVVQGDAQRGDLWQQGVKILEQIGAAAWLEGHSPQDPPFIAMFV